MRLRSGPDCLAATEGHLCRGGGADALVGAVVAAGVDEDGDGRFQFIHKEIFFLKDAGRGALMPAFDFALGLRMHRRTANVRHAFGVQVFRQIASDTGPAIVAEKARFLQNRGVVAA